MYFEFGPFIFALFSIAVGLLLVYAVGVRPGRDQRGREKMRREELRRAEINYARHLRARRQRPPLQIELEREGLWQPRPGRGANFKDAAAGVGRPAEIAAGVLVSPAAGAGPRVIEPGEPELLPETLLQVSEGPRPEWTLLQADAGLKVIEPNEPEFVPGLRASELVTGTLPQVDVGLQVIEPSKPELLLTRTLLHWPLQHVDAGLQLASGTLLQVEGSGPGGTRLVIGTLPQVSEGPQLVPRTLLRADARLRVIESGEPELVPALRAVEPTPLALLSVDAGQQPESVPGTLLRPAESLAVVVPSPAVGAGLPQSGLTLDQAMSQPVELRHSDTPIPAAQPVAFFEHLSPGVAERFLGERPLPNTQAVYTNVAPAAQGGADFVVDTFIRPPLKDQPVALFNDTFHQPQFAAPSAFPTVAPSDYNSGQFTLRQRFRDGLTFDFSDSLTFDFDDTLGPQPEPVSETLLQVDGALQVIDLNVPELVSGDAGDGGVQPTEITADVVPGLTEGAGLQLVPATLPQADGGLRVIEPSKPELLTGNLLPVTLLRADAGLQPASGTLLQVEESGSGGSELVPGTLPRVSAVAQPVLWTLLQADAGRQVIEPGEPELVPGLRAFDLIEPELPLETLLRVDVETRPDRERWNEPELITRPLLQVGAGLQVIDLNEPELVPATLPLVDESGPVGDQPARITLDDVMSAFEMFAATAGRPARITADDVKSAFEMFVAARPATGD